MKYLRSILISLVVINVFNILTISSPTKTIDCEQCCKSRSASRECCKQCGGCQMYGDEGTAECKDLPT